MQNGKPFGPRQMMLLSAAGVIIVLVLALVVFDAVALPGCRSCHVRDGFRTATAAAPHASVDCRSCHVPAGALGRLGFALHQPLHMFVGATGGTERDAAAVPDSRCLACHEDVRARVVAANGVRISHKSCAAGASCSDCHSPTAHGEAARWPRVYEMDGCLACHISKKKTECDLCHEGRDPSNRLDSPTFAVTHGPQWRSTHGMGDTVTCMVCHQADDCVGCHGPGLPHDADFVDVHAKFAVAKGAKCSGCHAGSFCSGCHGTPMPHSAMFTAGHPKTAAEQKDLCRRCHAASDCTECHVKHVHPGGVVGGVTPAGGGGR